jgi:hypothetical protein
VKLQLAVWHGRVDPLGRHQIDAKRTELVSQGDCPGVNGARFRASSCRNSAAICRSRPVESVRTSSV